MTALHSLAVPRLHPLHALLLAFPIALFTCALLADITYLRTGEIQWTNFAAWLGTGALLFGAPVLVWAAVLAIKSRARGSLLYLALLSAMWLLGLVNAFQHGRDAWSSVGSFGLILSLLCAGLALAAGWIAHCRGSNREIVA